MKNGVRNTSKTNLLPQTVLFGGHKLECNSFQQNNSWSVARTTKIKKDIENFKNHMINPEYIHWDQWRTGKSHLTTENIFKLPEFSYQKIKTTRLFGFCYLCKEFIKKVARSLLKAIGFAKYCQIWSQCFNQRQLELRH